MTIVRSESSSHLGELHRAESSSTGSVSTVWGWPRLLVHSTTLSYRASDEQMCCCQVHHFVDVTDLAPLARPPFSSGSSHTSSEPAISQPVCAWASSSAVLGWPWACVPAEIASIECYA